MGKVEKISKKLTELLYKEDIISEENFEFYEYGFQITIANIFNALIVLLVGILMDCFLNMILFYFVFVSLRFFCGGYHADTYSRCFQLFGVTCFIEAGCGKLLSFVRVEWVGVILLAGFVVLGACIYLWAPIEHKNKILTNQEKKHYRTCCWTVYVFWLVVSVVLVIMGRAVFMSYVAIALILVSIFMLIEKEEVKRK